MYRRAAIFATTVVAILVLSASSAFGWGNGGDDGDGYGTHDWLLDHAIEMLGEDASWVDVPTALLATDDPDKGDTETPREWHAYKNSGAHQGGPQATAEEYYQVVKAYNEGDFVEASRHLGLMSHYFTDSANPYHADIRGTVSRNPRHFDYEVEVSRMTKDRGDMTTWLSVKSREQVADVRNETIEAALYARAKFAKLDYSYKANGKVAGYAYTATGLLLNRSANDLADIIAGVPTGRGVTEPPASMKQRMNKMTYKYPRRGTAKSDSIRSDVYCYDEDGKPMRGVPVTFSWPLASGTKSVLAYTDANGLAYTWQAPGTGIALMTWRTVSTKTKASGKAATSATQYMPTPELAYSKAGLSSIVSKKRPRRGTKVRVRTRVRSKAGKPVAGLKITFSWCFKGKTVRASAVTNSNGYAYSTQRVPRNVPKGRRVYVKSKTYAGRHTRDTRTVFVPR